MKKCQCGAENEDNEIFCVACGEQLQELPEKLSSPAEACDEELLKEIKELEIPRCPIVVRVAGWTDKGNVRLANEDNFKIQSWLFPDNTHRLDLLIVSDGMGGGEHGAEFAYIGVNKIAGFIGNFVESSNVAELNEIAPVIQAAVQSANEEVLKYRFANQIKGVNEGATLVMAAIVSDLTTGKIACHSWNEGDSRLYMWDGKELYRLSKDHTLAGGLNRFLGKHRTVGGDALNLECWVGEHSEIAFVLCTDGFSDMLLPAQIQEGLTSNPHPALAVEELVEKAKTVADPREPDAKPGDDNITVVIWQAKPVLPKPKEEEENGKE